jgi:hypothetical protein
MSELPLKLQLLARAEWALARIRMQRTAIRSAMFACAGVFALFGLGMLNFAAFHAMNPGFGPALAGLFVAVIDMVLAGGVLFAALKAGGRESEENLALEMRELAQTELNRDIEQVNAELAQISADVRKIHSSLTSFSSVVANTVGPVLGLLRSARS